jgi:hypothetical protein
MGLVRVVNVSSLSVAIPDMLVHLAGRGDETTVGSDVVSSSKDLSSVRHLVRLIPVVTEKKMPLWPFHKPGTPAPAAPPTGTGLTPPSPPQSDTTMAPTVPAVHGDGPLLSEIRDLLKVLVHQGSATSHTTGRQSLPDAAGPSDAPIFIPDSIVPRGAEVKINMNSSEVQKPDFESAKNALSKARKR